ncbi:MAG: Gfo/Idh/MocA family oxidoreductase [Gemmatimonadaceae bacterium]
MTIRVGLAGYGLAGSVFHAPLVAATPGMRLTLVSTSNPERAAAARRDHPGVETVPDADALVARAGDLDLLVVGTPNATHFSIADVALGAGLHVVVDKPFTATAAEGRALIEKARRNRRVLTVFQNRRWDGDFLTVRRLIESGRLGDVYRFESHFDRWRPEPRAGWKNEGDAPGAGLVYDIGPHLIDQALLLFGPAASVFCEQRMVRAASNVVDDAFIVVRHRSGISSHLVMSLVAAEGGPRFRVLGSRGSYTKYGLDVQEDSLRKGVRPGDAHWGEDPEDGWGRLANGTEVQSVPTERGAYERYYAELADAIRGDAPPPVDPADSVAGLAVIEAANFSATGKRVVELH